MTHILVQAAAGAWPYIAAIAAAVSLALLASRGFEGPEVHGWSSLNKQHVHLKFRMGGHIFFG